MSKPNKKTSVKPKANTYPNISVDCVIFGYKNNQLNVLLIKRKGSENFSKEQYALPGDLLSIEDSLDDAANKILYKLTNFRGIFLKQFYAFGDPRRVSNPEDREWLKASRKNPGERVITIAYFALVNAEDYSADFNSPDGETCWTPINAIPKLTFDHNVIVDKAYAYLQANLIDKQIGFELLPEKFTLSELQSFYETILNVQYDKRNFRKSIKSQSFIKKLDEKVEGLAHRPARLYTYEAEKK